jgi:hypothetical protein
MRMPDIQRSIDGCGPATGTHRAAIHDVILFMLREMHTGLDQLQLHQVKVARDEADRLAVVQDKGAHSVH